MYAMKSQLRRRGYDTIPDNNHRSENNSEVQEKSSSHVQRSSCSSAPVWTNNLRENYRAAPTGVHEGIDNLDDPLSSFTRHLEIEAAPPDVKTSKRRRDRSSLNSPTVGCQAESIPEQTKSGLLLSHRRSSSLSAPDNDFDANTEISTKSYLKSKKWIQPSSVVRGNAADVMRVATNCRSPTVDEWTNFDNDYEDVPFANLCTERRGHRIVLSHVKVCIAAFVVLVVTGSGIACVAVHYSHRQMIRTTMSSSLPMQASLDNIIINKKELQRLEILNSRSELHPMLFAGPQNRTLTRQQALNTNLQPAQRRPRERNRRINEPTLKQQNKRVLTMELDNASAYPPALSDPLLQAHQPTTKRHGILLHHEHRHLTHLLDPFQDWVDQHRRSYHSTKEKQNRFFVWATNHEQIKEKNRKHGPCKITGQPIFGSNNFQDLTDEEFETQFLTGYKSAPQRHNPRKLKQKQDASAKNGGVSSDSDEIPVLQPKHPLYDVNRHPAVQELYEQEWKANMQINSNSISNRRLTRAYKAASTTWCSVDVCGWNLYCWYNCLRNYYENGSYGTMVPASLSDDALTGSLDWRKLGVVSSVHSQGNCGACWAITAVETIESAYAIYSGNLLDLDETEVIVCDDSCKMCNGGWPQNAYDFVKQTGGLRVEGSSWSSAYDGDFLLQLTMASQGYYDSMTYDEISYYKSKMCAASSASGASSNQRQNSRSGDRENPQQQYQASSSSSSSGEPRYANIKGYGYTTNKCTCYTNGNGCDCANQNEALAIQNIATYGPSTVCLDASNWKQYTGGVMTTNIGCSSQFLDMNHCVQVVGYVFTDSSSSQTTQANDDAQQKNSKSNKGNDDKAKENDENQAREGYFIVRNQWSSSWGMNGYAYVAMGSNTCGILNDMTNAFMA